MTALNHDDERGVIDRYDETEADDESGTESSDEEDEESEDTIAKKIKKKFDGVIYDLKRSAENKNDDRIMVESRNLADPEDLKTFMSENYGYLAKKSTRNMNLLHFIAEAEKKELPRASKMKDFITELVRLPEDLLQQRDDNEKTPLFCAVANRHHKLVKVMCQAHREIKRILKIPKSITNSTNCIHQAIIKKASSNDDDLVKFLIDKADSDTLCAYDENGLTPLHLAVEYSRCDEAQVQVVQALVEKCDAALDRTYKHPDKGPLSPYLYLQLTHEEARQKGRAAVDVKREADKVDAEAAAKGKGYPSRDIFKERERNQPKDTAKEASTTLDKPPNQPLMMPPRRAETFTGQHSMPPFPNRSKGPPLRIPPSNDQGKGGLATPTEQGKESDKKSSSKRSKGSRLKATDASADAVKQYLKLYYLRQKHHDAAVQFLYGSQQEKQIYFDLVGVTPKVSKGRITDGLNHLVFEDVLQYVAIPRVEVEDEPVRLKPGEREPKPDGNGRTDMKFLFNWLKGPKKVKTILKVIVDDLHEPSHSDAAIEECLAGMGVEEWDWRKRDLSPEVIQAVARKARIVHLYWGGNNAILRAWSEPEGLKKLTELKEVHLHVQQGLETRSRTRQNVEEFKARMSNARPEGIRFYEEKLRGVTANSVATDIEAVRDSYERHKWMESMEEFADFLQTAGRANDPESQVSLKHPVVVAVIDDGVDTYEPNIQSRVIGGRSFCHRDERQNLNQPYYVSGSGHGTEMAGLISKICPNVKLYILRLDEFMIEPGRRQITAKSAAKAVRAAVERKVDIISMSWTIEKTDRNESDIKELEEAVNLAAKESILMFCAATDQGAYKDHTYPAACTTKNIFKIGAAVASGTALKWVGDQSLVDFIFPGHKVPTERYDNLSVKTRTPLTGSSVATALASGLAAVILYCVQLAGLRRHTDHPDPLHFYKSLKNHERMKEVFLQIGTTKESENKYITVWSVFSRIVQDAKDSLQPKDTWINYVVQLEEYIQSTKERVREKGQLAPSSHHLTNRLDKSGG